MEKSYLRKIHNLNSTDINVFFDVVFCDKKHFFKCPPPCPFLISSCSHLWVEHNVMLPKEP